MIERELEAMAARSKPDADGILARLRAYQHEKRVIAAYQRLFLGGEGGAQLTPDAMIVLDDISRIAGLGKARIRASDAELRMTEGARMIVLHIISRFRADSHKLARLARQIRETRSE